MSGTKDHSAPNPAGYRVDVESVRENAAAAWAPSLQQSHPFFASQSAIVAFDRDGIVKLS
jgi:hypothetical protein